MEFHKVENMLRGVNQSEKKNSNSAMELMFSIYLITNAGNMS